MRPSRSLAVLLLALAAPAAGQEPTYGQPAGRDCETGPIGDIFIDNHSIFDLDDPDLSDRFEWAYRLANKLHVRTRESVVARELLFSVGECWDPELAQESERLLRNMPFIGRVDIFGVPQDDGSIHAVVDTQDEWSTRVDVRVRFDDGFGVKGAEVREENLLGTGQSIRLFYFEHEVEQDYGAEYYTPQLGGTRWDMTVGGGQTRAGTFVREELAFPFVGEVGRWAARQSFAREDQFFDFIAQTPNGERTHVLLPVRDKAFDIAVLSRIGPLGNLTVLGGALTFQELTYPGGLSAIRTTRGDFDQLSPGDSALARTVWDDVDEVRNIRMMLLLGQRNIWWIQRRGLDSMRGIQDVPLGLEVQLGIGRSIPALQQEDDLFTTMTVYAGVDAGTIAGAVRTRGDARRDFDAPVDQSEWEDVYAEGELLAYWRPGDSARHTLFGRVAGAAGWHTRTPFQLTIGGDFGLRGYDDDDFPGAQRITATLEDRIYLGWFRDVLDLGASVFVDAGRIFPGDVPFGIDSGWRASVGAGLRGAFPAGSRTTYRIDFAMPVESGVGFSDGRLIISIGEPLGILTNFGDPQLMRSRRGGLLSDVFSIRQ